MSLSRLAALTALLAGVTGCNPYERYTGEVNAGPVDPIVFPPPYLGTGGDRLRTGTGYFQAASAFVAAGTQVDYFQFPFSATLLATATAMSPDAPLILSTNGTANSRLPTPLAYVFDPADTTPFPSVARCTSPEGYTFDPVAEDVSKAEQGAIFTALPEAKYPEGTAATWNYNPVVSQVAVTSNGNACQGLKSEKTLLTATNVTVPTTTNASGTPSGIPSGKYLAWAVIDPGSAVYGSSGAPDTGVGIQKWGWFKRYLLAYIDGGYIPTETVTTGMPARTLVKMKAQRIFYPRTLVTVGTQSGPGELGQGYDVLDAARSAATYSPICQVLTYAIPGGDVTPTPAEMLPKDAATITTLYGASLQAPAEGDAYVYCLQTN